MDLKPSNVTADTLGSIRTETSKDPVLCILNSVTMTRWPDERKSVPEEIRVFWSYREEITAENGVLFILDQVSRFARDYGFALVKSSHYHSRGNGKAESAEKIAKNISKKSREEDPFIALLAYRNTPQQGHVHFPAQRFMSRRLRDLIPMATSKLQPQLTAPNVVTKNITERKQKAKAHYDKRASKQLREFTIGERVFVKPSPRNRSKPWIYGEVINKPAP